MLSVSPTNQDLSNDTTFSQIKSRVPVSLKGLQHDIFKLCFFINVWTIGPTPKKLFIVSCDFAEIFVNLDSLSRLKF